MIKWLLQPNYLVTTLMQLMLPVFLYLAYISGASIAWWGGTLVFYFIYLAIGNNVGFHRFFCHRYFEMYKPIEWVVTWAATVSCLGSPLSYVIIHNIHHKFSDTNNDVHGPQFGWKSVLFCFHKHINSKEIVCTRNLSRLTKQYHILHDYYTIFVLLNALIFLVLGWKVFLFYWALPASMTLWAVAFVLLLQHEDNQPSNTRRYQWFGWGETFHKNHHDHPQLKNHAMESPDVDWTYHLCKLLAKRGSID